MPHGRDRELLSCGALFLQLHIFAERSLVGRAVTDSLGFRES
jgi:hypothetical protein